MFIKTKQMFYCVTGNISWGKKISNLLNFVVHHPCSLSGYGCEQIIFLKLWMNVTLRRKKNFF